MGFLRVEFDLDDFRARLSKTEMDVGTSKRELTREKLKEVKSYSYLAKAEEGLWRYYDEIRRLSDELYAVELENQTFEMKISGEKLDELSKRISDVLATVVGMIRGLSERKDALYREMERRSLENYENWMNALPGDFDEGC